MSEEKSLVDSQWKELEDFSHEENAIKIRIGTS